MRVVAGRLKGRRLRAPDTPGTRPVTDRVKESIFSSLAGVVPGARVADLYAGAGSFGIEALSRGADSAVFVENGRKALAALRANLHDLKLHARIAPMDVARWIDAADAEFDLIFCDPPWPMDSTVLSGQLAQMRRLVDRDGMLIVTRRATDQVPEPSGFAIDDERRHGDTRIIRYMRSSDERPIEESHGGEADNGPT